MQQVLYGCIAVLTTALALSAARSARAQTPARFADLFEISAKEREAFGLTREKPEGKGCIGKIPAIPLRKDSLADTLALKAVLATMPPKQHTVFSVLNVAGEARILWLETTMSKEKTAEIAAAVQAAVIDSVHHTNKRQFRLRLDTDPAKESIRVSPGVECAPMLLNRDEISRQISTNARAVNTSRVPLKGAWTTKVWSFVRPDGSVSEARVIKSSGNEDIDHYAALTMVKLAKFRPASIEGSPMAVWVSIDLITNYGR